LSRARSSAKAAVLDCAVIGAFSTTRPTPFQVVDDRVGRVLVGHDLRDPEPEADCGDLTQDGVRDRRFSSNDSLRGGSQARARPRTRRSGSSKRGRSELTIARPKGSEETPGRDQRTSARLALLGQPLIERGDLSGQRLDGRLRRLGLPTAGHHCPQRDRGREGSVPSRSRKTPTARCAFSARGRALRCASSAATAPSRVPPSRRRREPKPVSAFRDSESNYGTVEVSGPSARFLDGALRQLTSRKALVVDCLPPCLPPRAVCTFRKRKPP
jgi:hypothetical protein